MLLLAGRRQRESGVDLWAAAVVLLGVAGLDVGPLVLALDVTLVHTRVALREELDVALLRRLLARAWLECLLPVL